MVAPLSVSIVRGLASAAQASPLKRRKSTRDEVAKVAKEHALPSTLAWTIGVLNDQKHLLERIAPEDFTRVDERIDGSIANHLRHSLAHFDAALASISDAAVVDYDERPRDTDVEHSLPAALARLREVKQTLRSMSSDPDILQRPTTAHFMVSPDGEKEEFKSTVGRELAFAAHHGTHHNAIMAWIARGMDYNLSDDFGLTYGTIHHNVSSGEM